ncbi:MAG: 3'-5' exonuclease [Bacilli bacterium]|jgi:DNA helicase-2/ATP-dependent DNA helicase PcrA|nr:3'-5' exonuclease [Bacilli bacterium]MDD3388995.1 3'-5' exonuclease [Bacilli bacterium]MDD4344434.1 3'-5' exonuclease [Bacilli bacterium]MDD4520662.1 3'-5' exonuclease [Bacilli bacterium]MDY0399363.1 3'-5' exonuclease [Bacilli bacterium]
MDFKKSLNERQLEAVTTAYPFVRVVAGAGSGKTRVLTYRIAYLIGEMNIAPWRILAITFTNKVANEMRERVIKLVPDVGGNLKILTFHSFCARFLREEISVLGYPSNFTIFDEDDQEKLMKTIAVDHGLRRGDEIVRLTLDFLGRQKMEGRYPEDIDKEELKFFQRNKECLDFWVEYEARMKKMLALDFDDLLIKAVNILRDFPDIRTKWQKRFDHILIDEFQDTNDIQAHLLHLLMREDTCLYVVGDPDQTIYTWRGANQGIILDTSYSYFDKKYKIIPNHENQMETIILNRNYRSTKTILDAANALISHNRMRVEKELFTENELGSAVTQHQARTIDDEASWVVEQLTRLEREERDFSYSQVAVLFRAAYLTLPLEKALTRRRIPYVIYGGIRFYQRAEIKDVLAYWRIINNPKDEVSFMRIINIPRRNLGDQSLNILKNNARQNEYSVFEYLKYNDPENWGLRPSTKRNITQLLETIDKYQHKLMENAEAYSELLREYIADVGYFDFLKKPGEGTDRLENINALIDDVRSYLKDNPTSNFEEYLQNVTLLSAQDDMDESNRLLLMTVHTAKGLEFPYIFVFGLNEGVFPSNRTLEESAYLGEEEERRLCYVAFTRAKKELYLSCNNDYSFVLSARNRPSRFFMEAGLAFRTPKSYKSSLFGDVPLFTDAKTINQDRAPVVLVDQPIKVETWKVGDQVRHDTFGKGVVKELIGDTIITVEFVTEGRKKLMGNHPAIHKAGGGDSNG